MPHKVLIVDDDPVNLRIVSQYVRSMNYEVEAFDDPVKAWESCASQDYAIAILDWLMPTLDGLELCRRIRGSAKGAKIAILIMTVRDAESDVSEALNAGANDYLRKPVAEPMLRIRMQVLSRNVLGSAT